MRPLLHYDASTKASLAFNSVPTFPRIDFGCGCLLSFCFYGLLKTQGLPPSAPAIRKQAFGARLVWLVQTLDLCDLVSH